MVESRTAPVLRYVRTAHEWHPGLITDEEQAVLEHSAPVPRERRFASTEDLSRADRLLLDALTVDARRTYEELARLTGQSEATVRRHLDRLRSEGRVLIRAVVSPAHVGLPVEAMLWVRARPADVDTVADGLRQSQYVRYASRISGDQQFLVQVALPTPDALDDFVSRVPWASTARGVETAIVLSTLKRSGVILDTAQ